MSSTSQLDTVAGALALRGWALRVFAGVSPQAAPLPPWPSAEAWAVFLHGEHCAAPLRARLRAAGVELPDGPAALLRREATVETQRFLSVAAQLRSIGAVLREKGWPGVALKAGAAAAAGSEPLHALDLDLLVPKEHAAALAALLEARGGYRSLGADPGETLTGAWELAPRRSDDSVELDLHFDVPHLGEGISLWDDARPSRIPGISRPASAAHLWHLLVHAGLHHLQRRGRLRDLLLLRLALDDCGPEDVEVVRARIDRHRAAPVLRAMVAMARGFDSGREPEDPFRAVAAAAFALYAGAGRRLPERLRLMGFARSVFALAAGAPEYRRLWYGERSSVLPAAGFRGDTRLDRHLPGAAWAARLVVRAGQLAVCFPSAWRLHRSLRPLLKAGATEGYAP